MPLRCLIVDDSLPFLAAARMLLESEGVSVVGVASTSGEALERVRETAPDVTLVDIDLGAESGFHVARLLSGNGNAAQSKIILISTHAEGDFADLIDASPAVGFLPKSKLSAEAIREVLRTAED